MHLDEAKDDGGKPLREGTRLALSRTLVSVMKDGVFFADEDFLLSFANPALEELLGIGEGSLPLRLSDAYAEPANAAVLANAKAAAAAIGYWNGELARTDGSGSIRIDEVTLARAPVPEGERGTGLSFVGIVRDITRLKESDERLAWALHHDDLTGLPDRALFTDALGRAILRANQSHGAIAVILADLDNFKRFNTDYGHTEGDCILKAAAERLRAQLHPGDFIARTGGDEFSIIMPLREPAGARLAAELVRDAFEDAIRTDAGRYALKSSVGVAVWPLDGADPEALLYAADLAMQNCKDKGKDGVMCFDDSIYEDRRGKTMLEAELKDAISGRSLSVHYQPIVRVKDGVVAGAEALCRWKHPQRGDIPPESFIALAEETGLIMGLGELVLNNACNQGASWCKDRTERFAVGVNVSPMQLERPNFADIILDSVDRAGLSPRNLAIEITESVLVAKMDHAGAALKRLKALGVTILADDYGTGYSSLSYIKELPLDGLKIDKKFVSDMTKSCAAKEIISGTISLAHRLGIHVIAEGVETAEQFYLLRAMECDYAQGFLFGKAMHPADMEGRYLCRGGSRYSSFLFR